MATRTRATIAPMQSHDRFELGMMTSLGKKLMSRAMASRMRRGAGFGPDPLSAAAASRIGSE